MPRHSKTRATFVVCGGVGGRAKAKNSIFDEICGDLVARNQRVYFREVSVHPVLCLQRSDVYPGLLGVPQELIGWRGPFLLGSHAGQGVLAQRKCATAR